MCTDLGLTFFALIVSRSRPLPFWTLYLPGSEEGLAGQLGGKRFFNELLLSSTGCLEDLGEIQRIQKIQFSFWKDKAAVCFLKCAGVFLSWGWGACFHSKWNRLWTIWNLEGWTGHGERKVFMSLPTFTMTVTHKAEILFDSLKAKKRPFTGFLPIAPSWLLFGIFVW